MNERVKQIAEQARQLSPEEQEQLVEELLAMMHEPSPEWEKAWAEEVERRVAKLDRGEAVLRPADEALAELRARCQK